MLKTSIEFKQGTPSEAIEAALEQFEEKVDLEASYRKGVFHLNTKEEVLLEEDEVAAWLADNQDILEEFNCSVEQAFGFSICL